MRPGGLLSGTAPACEAERRPQRQRGGLPLLEVRLCPQLHLHLGPPRTASCTQGTSGNMGLSKHLLTSASTQEPVTGPPTLSWGCWALCGGSESPAHVIQGPVSPSRRQMEKERRAQGGCRTTAADACHCGQTLHPPVCTGAWEGEGGPGL